MLNTNVLVAALSNRRGASFILLNHAINRRISLLASPALELECEAVLKRAETTEIHQLTLQAIDDVLNALCEVLEPAQAHFLRRPLLRHLSDEMVLEAANATATHLITFNLRDFDPPVQRHRLTAHSRLGPMACRPADFLNFLEKPS